MMKTICNIAVGGIAGAVTGILGSGGGLVLVPLLSTLCKADGEGAFSQSPSIMLPICICSLVAQHQYSAVPFWKILPYLLGSAIGGSCAALIGKRIPAIWLHRCFGIIMLWSGIRCLFS